MKIGILSNVRNHPAIPYALEDVYADFISDAVLAEELGFDFVWFGEHHFTECQWTPSPMLVLAAVAAKTEHVRLGLSVLCLPFHDPFVSPRTSPSWTSSHAGASISGLVLDRSTRCTLPYRLTLSISDEVHGRFGVT